MKRQVFFTFISDGRKVLIVT